MDQLTVKQLIELLEKMPQDFLVYTEGCDCIGLADGVELGDGSDNYVLITRSN